MLNFYSNTKVNNPLGVLGGVSDHLERNDSKSLLGKNWFRLILCLLFIFTASCIASILFVLMLGFFAPRLVYAEDETYVLEQEVNLLDKEITWADGSTEHVQIDSDRYFVLDGEKRRLIGMELHTQQLPHGDGYFYEPDNLILFDRELTYLESVGVRLVHCDLFYVGQSKEELAYRRFLDLLTQHKMLVVPQLNGKWMPNFNNLTHFPP